MQSGSCSPAPSPLIQALSFTKANSISLRISLQGNPYGERGGVARSESYYCPTVSRPAPWDGWGWKWRKRRESMDCLSVRFVCVCVCETTGLWQAWQGSSRAALAGEANVIFCDCSQWTCHHQTARPSKKKKLKEAISPLLNPLSLSPTRPPTYHASFHSSSPSPFPLSPNPSPFLQLPRSLSKSHLLQLSLSLSPSLLVSSNYLFSPNPLYPSLTICNSILRLPEVPSLFSTLSHAIYLLPFLSSSLFFFLLFVGRQQDLPPSGCVSVITRGFTQRAVAENRGTKAIGHSTARRLLCHIKGERVIFQLQFTVSCHQLGERCGGVRVHVCVFGCSGASLCVRAAVRLAPHSTDCSVPVCMDTHVSVAGQADECVGVFVVVVSGA